MNTKRGARHLPAFPPEVWLCVFDHATYVPGALIPEIYDHANLIGPICTRAARAGLREALVTKRSLVRVCRQWWHLATPYLYRSVYIGRVRCLSSLSSTLARSVSGKGTVVSTRPLGEYTERLDIAIRDHAENVDAELDLLAVVITCMPLLAIVSFSITSSYAGMDLSDNVLKAFLHSAASLRVLDWTSARLKPSAPQIVDFLPRCTGLRVLNCSRLVWSKEFQLIPPTVVTLRVGAIVSPWEAAILPPGWNPDTICRTSPSALEELILDLYLPPDHWQDFLQVYSSQLVSVQFYVSGTYPCDIGGHLQLLTRACPNLRRLTIASDRYSCFIRPYLVFPSIRYLGLRALRSQSSRPEFEALFAFLENLQSSVPSLQVVQLLNEHNVACLLRMHTMFTLRALQPSQPWTFRLVDKNGVTIMDRLIDTSKRMEASVN